jgi:RNA polymerase sigma factor (sigma-70 family)
VNALEQLAQRDPRQLEIIRLRYLGGMSISEIAKYLNISTRTIERDWEFAKAWLKRELATRNDKTAG